MGLPGSGKSALAQTLEDNYNCCYVSPDLIRKKLTGDINDQSHNGRVFRLAHSEIVGYLNDKLNVIYDATSLKREYRQPLLDIAKDMGAETHLHVVDTDRKLCLERQEARGRVVPEDIFQAMESQFAISCWQIDDEAWDHITVYRTERVR